MKAHDPQYYEAQRILRETTTYTCKQVFKTTRSGATTGLCATAFDDNQRVIIVAPTIEIVTNTFEKSLNYTDVSPDDVSIRNIPGNRACLRIHDMIQEYPDLAKLPIIPLPSVCGKCKKAADCKVMEFLNNDMPNGVGLTTQKLNALMHSSSSTAKSIVEKLLGMSDVVIFDEAHKLETDNAATVRVYPYPDMNVYELVREKYGVLDDIVGKFNNIRRDNDESAIKQLVLGKDKSTDMLMAIGGINEGCAEDEYEPPAFKTVVSAIKQIVDIMKNRGDFGLSVADVLYLSDIVMVMSGDHLVMHYIQDEDITDDGDMVFLSSPGGLRNAVREFVIQLRMQGDSKILFTTGTFGDFYYGDMFGIAIDQDVMKDTRETNRMMTIHPDTFKISTRDYWRDTGHAYKPRIIKRIKHYHGLYPDAKFVCMTKKVAGVIRSWMKDTIPSIDFDYYGSTNMIGTDYDGRVMVCIGAPVCTINAHDGISRTFEESQRTRINGLQASFWQAASRAKDPNGEVPSHVYCIGIREDAIRMMCTWGIDRTIEIDGINCICVTVKDGEENSIGMPVIESMEVKQLVGLLQKNPNSDRSYIMRNMNMRAAELDKLLLHNDVRHVVQVSKIKTGRKAKKVYNLI